jgi:hypothetical protein
MIGESTVKTRRPKTITILATLLFAATIGGLVLVGLSPVFSQASGIAWPAFAVMGLGYGLSAAACAVGLWRLARWSIWAFGAWGVFVTLLSFLMAVASGATTWKAGIVGILAALTVSGLGWYVARILSRVDSETSAADI